MILVKNETDFNYNFIKKPILKESYSTTYYFLVINIVMFIQFILTFNISNINYNIKRNIALDINRLNKNIIK